MPITEVRIFFRVCITYTETINRTLFVRAIKFYIFIVRMNGAPSFQTFSNPFLINVKLFGCGGNSFFPRKFIGLQSTLEDSVLCNGAKLIHIVNCTSWISRVAPVIPVIQVTPAKLFMVFMTSQGIPVVPTLPTCVVKIPLLPKSPSLETSILDEWRHASQKVIGCP